VRAGGGDGELLARRLHAGDVCGADHAQAELLLVGAVVFSDQPGRRYSWVRPVHWQPGQIRDAVDGTQGEGVPAVPPGAAGAVVGGGHEDVSTGGQTTAKTASWWMPMTAPAAPRGAAGTPSPGRARR